MKRSSLLMVLVVWLSLGVCADGLARFQAARRSGRPGLRVVAAPIFNPQGKVVGDHSVYLPERVSDYTSQPAPVTDLELNWLPKDTTYGRRVYRGPDEFAIQLSVVLMGTDRTSIHKPQYCLTGQGWTIRQSEKDTILINHPHPYRLPVMKLTTRGEIQTSAGTVPSGGVYVYWFVADGELTADHGQRMWWMARDLLTQGVLQRWAYVTCFAVCQPGAESATYERLKRFIVSAVPDFQLTSGRDVAATKAPTTN